MDSSVLFEDILVTLWIIGAAIVLLQIMIIVVWWRKGSKYAKLERVYRERQAEAKAREAEQTLQSLVNWDIHEEDREDPVHPAWYAKPALERLREKEKVPAVESSRDFTAWDVQADLDDPPEFSRA